MLFFFLSCGPWMASSEIGHSFFSPGEFFSLEMGRFIVVIINPLLAAFVPCCVIHNFRTEEFL